MTLADEIEGKIAIRGVRTDTEELKKILDFLASDKNIDTYKAGRNNDETFRDAHYIAEINSVHRGRLRRDDPLYEVCLKCVNSSRGQETFQEITALLGEIYRQD